MVSRGHSFFICPNQYACLSNTLRFRAVISPHHLSWSRSKARKLILNHMDSYGIQVLQWVHADSLAPFIVYITMFGGQNWHFFILSCFTRRRLWRTVVGLPVLKRGIWSLATATLSVLTCAGGALMQVLQPG
jgi:hypothetical protein